MPSRVSVLELTWPALGALTLTGVPWVLQLCSLSSLLRGGGVGFNSVGHQSFDISPANLKLLCPIRQKIDLLLVVYTIAKTKDGLKPGYFECGPHTSIMAITENL